MRFFIFLPCGLPDRIPPNPLPRVDPDGDSHCSAQRARVTAVGSTDALNPDYAAQMAEGQTEGPRRSSITARGQGALGIRAGLATPQVIRSHCRKPRRPRRTVPVIDPFQRLY
jgi:hypothetical protein